MLRIAIQICSYLVGLPLEFDGVRPPYRFSAPKLGEHNALLDSSAAEARKKTAR